jgi:phosphoribosylformimino-5-aminoimidazole carboxamide ribotide isomerase
LIVIPAVDIKNGKCIQLVQGIPGTEQVVLENPVKIAKEWEEKGAKLIHVIDLGGALEGSKNLDVVKGILNEVSVPIQVGGGIRTREDAIELLEMGVSRIILGTLALDDPNCVKELASLYGKDKIVVALDSKDSRVLVKGWTEKTDKTTTEMGRLFSEYGAGTLLFTNVDYEGLMDGFAMEPLNELLSSVNIPVIYSGGITSLSDVAKLSRTKVSGIVIGSALYKGNISFEEAIKYEK